jgi:hypothetical protein
MISMAAAAGNRHDETMAVAAAKLFQLSRSPTPHGGPPARTRIFLDVELITPIC